MDPASDPIRDYIRLNRDRYTREAIRAQLIAAGHSAEDVDRAWEELAATPTKPSGVTDRRRFWRWAFGFHAAVLVIIGILSIVIGSFFAGSWGLLIILAVVLLIGLGISGMIGRGSVQGGRLATALVAPAISALLIGGSCLAVGGTYLLRPPPRSGVMELHIEPPLSFDASGVGHCDNFGGTSSFLVWAEDLGRLDGSVVSVSLDSSTRGGATGGEFTNLSITLYPQSENDQPVSYSPIFSTGLELDASPDGRSGTLRFEALEPAVGEEPPGGVPGLEPISGTVTWTCE